MLYKLSYDLGQDWTRFDTTLGSHDVTCPKLPEIARHEEDHLCRVPHLRKKFNALVG